MKVSSLSLLSLAAIASAAPAAINYGVPEGGWENVKYPAGTGEGLHEYPAPPGGWENVKYPAGTGETVNKDAQNDDGPPCGASPFKFTSSYTVHATGAEVRNGTTSAPGPSDAKGIFSYGINSAEDIICWNITLYNVKGTYQSPAKTATHIHEAAKGASGPPRLAFPNPEGDDTFRQSVGCAKGPFTTGVMANGADTGTGFKVARIEQNPAAFFTDAHTNLFPLGVVRGQLG